MRISDEELGYLNLVALEVMEKRSPDVMVIAPDGTHYLHRWHLIPLNNVGNVYLQKVLGDDPVPHLHDQPWDFRTVVLQGGYIQHSQSGAKWFYGPGQVVDYMAEDRHRMTLQDGAFCTVMIWTGMKRREWGFDVGDGWVHCSDYLDRDSPSDPFPGASAPRSKIGTNERIEDD